MVTRATDSPRGSCWPNSSVPCDPGIQPGSVPLAAQPDQRHPPGQGGAGWADIAPPLPLDTTEPLAFILSFSAPLSHTHTHTHTHPHTSPPPPCRDTATSPPSTPPFEPFPSLPPSTGCFKQGWAEQIRLMPWETLPRPEPFSSWAIPGLEVARKRK